MTGAAYCAILVRRSVDALSEKDGNGMIAEIHGKISATGSNLSDRLEDKLTGDIFGSLRYLPFELGIGPILSAAQIPELSELIEKDGLHICQVSFWPYHPLGELDVRIDLDNAVIGIEVKYQSPLSSDDDADYSNGTDEESEKVSVNQLYRESKIVRELAGPDKKAFLILVACDSECESIVSDVKARNLIENGVELGRISWQEILLILENQQPSDPLHNCILGDMVALLKRKGFERFHGFDSPMTAICADGYFSYQYNQDLWSHLFAEPLIDGGNYYEFE